MPSNGQDFFRGPAVRAYQRALAEGRTERQAIQIGLRVARAKGILDEQLMRLVLEKT